MPEVAESKKWEALMYAHNSEGYMQARIDMNDILLDLVYKGVIHAKTGKYVMEEMERMNEVRKVSGYALTKREG